MIGLLFTIVFISLSATEKLKIVDQNSLVCFVDKVQFTITKAAIVKQIKATNGKCSKIVGDERIFSFDYKECGAIVTYLQPYGPLTKMDFMIEMKSGETYEFGTQCFFDDTIGWSPVDDKINVTIDVDVYQQEFFSPPEIKATLINADKQQIKSARLGEMISLKLQLIDTNYKAMLLYDCKFSGSKDIDKQSDIHFIVDGCPIKFARYINEIKRESLTSYILSFNAFQIDSNRSLFIKCAVIKLCTSVKNLKCKQFCHSNGTSSELVSTSPKKVFTKQKSDVGEDKIVWFRDSIEITNCPNNFSNNGTVLSLAVINVLLLFTVLFVILLMIRMRRNHTKSFKIGQVSRRQFSPYHISAPFM